MWWDETTKAQATDKLSPFLFLGTTQLLSKLLMLLSFYSSRLTEKKLPGHSTLGKIDFFLIVHGIGKWTQKMHQGMFMHLYLH